MDAQTLDALVLGTVNAPYRVPTDAAGLEKALKDADPWGEAHLLSFFADVSPSLVFQFAGQHGVSLVQLKTAYQALVKASGSQIPHFEKALEQLEIAA